MRKSIAAMLVALALAGCSGSGAAPDLDAEAAGDPGLDGSACTTEACVAGPVRVDLLLVQDNSSGACQEQNALARSIGGFVEALTGWGDVDLRVAVTTTDVRSEGFKGAFRNVPATAYSPACQVNVVRECTADAQCDDLGPLWQCTGEGGSPGLNVNENGSVDTACHKGCNATADCTAAFGDTYECSTAAGANGCYEPPQTADCPTDLPTVLDRARLADLRCSVAVGADATPNRNLEAGLKAGWLALSRPADPCASTNPNTCDLYSGDALEEKRQWAATEVAKIEAALAASPDASRKAELEAYRTYLEGCEARLAPCTRFIDPDEPNFLRDDAWLVVLFFGDDDDCSDRDDNPLSLNDARLCAYMDDHLIPVKDLVSQYRALKTDAARVIAIGVVGDGLVAGSDSCVMSDQCVTVRSLDACACYRKGGDKSACPELLRVDGVPVLCNPDARGTPAASPAAVAEELAYRLACVDACLGKKAYKPDHKCSKLVPDACRCYDVDEAGTAVNAATLECQAALADEPGYRVACQRACFVAARKVSAVQPNTAPYGCSSALGIADLGARYIDFVGRFGDHGLLESICSVGGLEAVFARIAPRVVEILRQP